MPFESYVPSSDPGVSGLRRRLGLASPAEHLMVYVGAASPSWTAAMSDAIAAASSVTMRVGLDIPTPMRTGELLAELAKGPNRDIQLLRHVGSSSYFHPKLYVAKRPNEFAAVIGSSNASSGAFGRNLEANLVVSGQRGSPEETMVDEIVTALETQVATRAGNGEVLRYQLPTNLPVWSTPPAGRSAAPIAQAAAADAWQTDPGYLGAGLVADFYAPVSGLSGYVADTGRQGGFDIEDSQQPAVEQLIPQGVGAFLELAWRFITPAGRTIFQADDGPRQVQQSGYGPNSHNRTITISKGRSGRPDIARPCWAALQSAGVEGGEAHILYKLEHRAAQPDRLWMVHTVPVPGEATLGEDA